MSLIKLIKEDSNIIICGKRNSGKTYLAKYFTKCFFSDQKIDYAIVISPTLFNGSWDCIPKKYHYSPKQAQIALQKILSFQKLHFEEDIHALVIIDDSLGKINFNCPFYDNLYSIARHYNITLITISQYIFKISPLIKTNADFVCIFKQYGERFLTGIHQVFFSFMKKQEYMSYIKDKT